MKNYAEKFEQVKTLKELFDFRFRLMEDAKTFSGNMDNLDKCQEANRFERFVTDRIDYLIANGYSLDAIQEPPPKLAEPLK